MPYIAAFPHLGRSMQAIFLLTSTHLLMRCYFTSNELIYIAKLMIC